jgi:hypothetical protein
VNDISTGHNEYRLAGTLAHLDLGSGYATLSLYAGAYPSTPGAAAPGTLLAEFVFAKPSGVVAAGELTMALPPVGTVLATGVATWGRFTNGDGAWNADFAVSDEAGSAPIKMVTTQLYAGGLAVLTSAAFT